MEKTTQCLWSESRIGRTTTFPNCYTSLLKNKSVFWFDNAFVTVCLGTGTTMSWWHFYMYRIKSSTIHVTPCSDHMYNVWAHFDVTGGRGRWWHDRYRRPGCRAKMFCYSYALNHWIFWIWCWDNSNNLCGDRTRYLKPKYDLFQTLTECFLCLKLTSCHNVISKKLKMPHMKFQHIQCLQKHTFERFRELILVCITVSALLVRGTFTKINMLSSRPVARIIC